MQFVVCFGVNFDEVNFDEVLLNKKNLKRYIFLSNMYDITVARLLGCSYGQLLKIQILQKTVQLSTFCVKGKEKFKCKLFLKNCIVYVIYLTMA